MTAFLIRRLAFAVVTLFAVLTLVFVLVRIVPGDPAQVILGDQASREAIEAMRARLGLDKPVWQQYVDVPRRARFGATGASRMVTGRPVIEEVLNVLPWTIELTLVSLLLGMAIGVPLGVWAAVNRNRAVDYASRASASLLGLSFPPFVSAILLLLVFAIAAALVPGDQRAAPAALGAWFQSITLPAINLGLIMAAYITRVTRSAMLEVLDEDYVRTARAKGVPWRVVVWRHALRNALIPVITVVGLYLGILIGNSVLTEIVFNRPGLGKLIVGALNQRDYTMLQGMMVIYTLIVVLVNLADRPRLWPRRSAGEAAMSASAHARSRLPRRATACAGSRRRSAPSTPTRPPGSASSSSSIVVLAAALAPWLAPHDPLEQNILSQAAAAASQSTSSAPTISAATSSPASCTARASRSSSASPRPSPRCCSAR